MPKKVQKEHKEKARRPVSDSEDSVKVVTEVSFRPPVSWFQYWAS